MVERFHRHFKAAIMCHLTLTWVQAIPIVLLGIRAALKEDIHLSAADMVYGEPLRLPGELLVSSNEPIWEPVLYADKLRSQMATLRPTPASKHSMPGSFVFKDLANCTHAFLRDETRKSLQPPYTGPHKIIRRDDKTFTLLVKNKETVVSIDRLKPAYVENEERGNPVQTKQTEQTEPNKTNKTTESSNQTNRGTVGQTRSTLSDKEKEA
nr:PREDICTED: uncharacterized protein LOC109038438 [Bemisia tabaci]